MSVFISEMAHKIKAVKEKAKQICLFYGENIFYDIEFIGENYPILYLRAPSYIASKRGRGFMANEIQEVESLILKELRCQKIIYIKQGDHSENEETYSMQRKKS